MNFPIENEPSIDRTSFTVIFDTLNLGIHSSLEDSCLEDVADFSWVSLTFVIALV